jgi:phage regulator Rha-like protein
MSKVISLAQERIFKKIYLIRKQKVLLDSDLAELYGVDTKRLKEQVKRNLKRFPSDFMFVLTNKEHKSLRSQIATLETGRGKYSKYPPYAFTEQGIAMLSTVLNSERAIAINIQIMRLFVEMRQLIGNNKRILQKIEKLEAADMDHDKKFREIYGLIKNLLEPAFKNSRKIGFKIGSKNSSNL